MYKGHPRRERLSGSHMGIRRPRQSQHDWRDKQQRGATAGVNSEEGGIYRR